jgi:serine/threonine-protein kinase HipA
MRRVLIKKNNVPAAELKEVTTTRYEFYYLPEYRGKPVSLTLPLSRQTITFDSFPAFLDNLLPEGFMLEALLKRVKLDKTDYLGQLICLGQDLVGDLSVEEIIDE